MIRVKKSKKTVAIVHDALVEWGGAEKVLDEMLRILPEATLFTSVYLREVKEKLKHLHDRQVQTSWLQKYWNERLPRRIIQLLAPFIWPFLDLGEYDVVFIHSGFYLSKLSALATQKNKQKVICYVITPPKNVYFKNLNLEKFLFYSYYFLLRFLDKKSNTLITSFFSVSGAVSQRVSRIYEISSEILYPPCISIQYSSIKTETLKKTFGYFGRLSPEKNLDLLIKVFAQLPSLRLEIIGEGSMKERLEKLSTQNIHFFGYLDGQRLAKRVSKWKALIHPAIEDDFPLSVVEALHLGVPAICHKSGGVMDYIQDRKNGFFFKENTVKSIKNAILKCLKTSFSPSVLKQSVKKYSTQHFELELKRIIYEKA